MTDVDLSFLNQVVAGKGRGESATIPILQAVQEHYGYLPAEALERICELTDIAPAAIFGVATFYSHFRHRPAGQHLIKVCVGTACHVKGAEGIHDAFREHLSIEGDQDTDADRRFTVEKVACLGCCMLAPAVQIGKSTYGHLTPDTVSNALRDFLNNQKEVTRAEPGQARTDGEPLGQIRISLDTCCLASGARHVAEALGHAIQATRAPAVLKGVGCSGKSYLEPLVEVVEAGGERMLYQGVKPDDAEAIVRRHFRPRGFARRVVRAASAALDALLTDASWRAAEDRAVPHHHPSVEAFDRRQVRIATEYCGQSRPTDLEEYLRHDGFTAIRRCLETMTPEQVLSEVTASGLRGRGGGGYLTGRKWSQVRAADGGLKYVIVNGDEGDPGAFMDRMLLESQPYRVIEGTLIAAYAVGAQEGHVYVRAEYPLAVQRMSEAIRQCRERGFLGEDLLGGRFRFRLDTMEAAGAFVCGEETALMASIEGRRGMPRLRPPYPTEQGLWGRPTLVNNVETFSVLPWIIRNGAQRFSEMGTETSKGTKVFALAGKVARGGLIEVPMGITLREIVEEIGGGVPDGKALKAVQVGGPSGGCVPAAFADTPVDYDALRAVGAMMGSGGLVVLDETDCMVEIARYFLEFTQDQSCGKCTFCRVGTRRMLDLLERLCAGDGREGDLERLEELGHLIQRNSICGLGSTAPNPVLSTLKHFREEYEAHLASRCPAGRCKGLITYSITDDCIGCTLCAQHCPADAIEMRPYEKQEIDTDKCVRCGTCKTVCPADAVKVE